MKKITTLTMLMMIALCGCQTYRQTTSGSAPKSISLETLDKRPSISPPYVIGIRPQTPLIHTIGATGQKPITFGAKGLPAGLTIDKNTGVITGTVSKPGKYEVTVTASNATGTRVTQNITIAVGDTLALTPPMAWMTWNMFAGNISEQLIKEIADAMVATGMRDVGYEYIVIDDLWQGKRNANGYIAPDPEKFPNGMKVVADYVHSKGLKLGIYSDAAEYTCAGALGSLGYEQKDAQTYADWGIDYLKYDYCGAPADTETAIKRYTAMGDALKATNRSMIFAACEWGPRKPWLWAGDAGAHIWRTTWDIRDTWDHGRYDAGHNGIINCLDRHVGLEEYARPGRWNDPDMIIVGLNGKGGPSNANGAKGCTETEYRSQMSLWCLLAAPLITSNDLRNMDQTSLEIITNIEAIKIDQDPMGVAASRIAKDGDLEIWARPLSDGSKAVGLLNRGQTTAEMTVTFKQLDIKGTQIVTDVWGDKFNGVAAADKYTTQVPPHGVAFLKFIPSTK